MGLKPGYKQTEVGAIPEDWQSGSLGDVADVVMGQSPAGSSYNKAGVGLPLINGPTEFTDKYPVKIQWTSEPTKLCRSGDLLLCVRGSSTGRMNVSDDQYCIGRGVAAIRARVSSDTRFLTYQVGLGVQRLLALSAGSTFPNVDGRSIRSIKLPLPSEEAEQRAIAGALSDVDALIGALDQLIAKKRGLKQASMQQLLTGKQRLPGFHGEWEVKKLGVILSYEQPTKYLVKSSEYNDNNDIAVLTANKSFILGYTDENDDVFENVPVVIFDDFTTASKYVEFPFKVKSSALKILKLKDESSDLRFVFWKMQLIGFPLGGHKRYWISEYQHLELELPSFEKQTAIATVLSDMDAELAALEQRRDKTRALKQGMMQELLTGKTRLPFDEGTPCVA